MFSAARLRLTLWYLAILSAVVALLSLVLYEILVRLQNTELQAVNRTSRSGIAQLFARDEGQLALQILALDGGILILAALGAYVLAGRTLGPIAQAMDRQERFAAAASHELRTPLTVLQGRLEVTLLKTRTPAEYEQAIRQTAEEAQRMGVLVQDLLTLARVRHDADALNLELLDLRDIVGEVLKAVQPLADEKSFLLAARMECPLMLQGDALKLRQVVSTLLDNAITYTPRGGSVQVHGAAQRDRVTLTVRDSGPGIAPEHLPHIFEPFYRVDRARSGSGSHAGLGLALAAWVVQAHRGQIIVDSRPGKGSAFSISLPGAS
jgi:signal transduction histidine kinase